MKPIYLIRMGIILTILFSTFSAFAQLSISGTVTDENGPLPGVSVVVKGTSIGTQTDMDGKYTIEAGDEDAVLVFSFMGYASQEIPVNGRTAIDVVLTQDLAELEEVVVVGYGTQRKQDLTGAITSVSTEDFNKGPLTAPDQLIQGKVAGVQMINNSGQPGGGTTVKIRGNSAVTGTGQPLYIVDGVALDGRSARPSQSTPGLSSSPAGNPLNFINPADIESIEVLKDASATAIYGSRAAYGVVIINTKRGQSGETRVDVNSSGGFSDIMRRIDVLNGDEYRNALAEYGLSSGDFGDNVSALDVITRTAANQNHSLSVSGGNENNRYRASLGYQDQQGIIRKTDFKRYSAAFNGNFKMLESKKLGLDVSLLSSQNVEHIAPITTNAGARGSLISHAMIWNPTRSLRNPDGSLLIEEGNIVNPLAMSEAYNDKSTVSNILASVAPSYQFTDWLEYKMLLSINYSKGERRTSVRDYINYPEIQSKPDEGFLGGYARVANNELITQQITHTLSFNREIAASLNLNAVVGYEYMNFINRGSDMDATGFGDIPVDYTDVMQATAPANRETNSFNDPTTELQSFFGRVNFNYNDRYLLTATLRSDGSTRFGENNKYGFFPSFAAAWNIHNEDFFGVSWISQLKLRAGYGRTGNQEFPSGAAQLRYSYDFEGGEQSLIAENNANDDLKWQSDEQINVGVDFVLFNSRLNGTVDYFYKKTTDLLFPQIPFDPAAADAAVTWINLPGQIINKGVEVGLNAVLIENDRLTWTLGGNATFLDNAVKNVENIIRTGSLSGPGLSDVTIEVIQEGLPLYAMVTRRFEGLDEEGFSQYTDDGFTLYYVGDPNPNVILGLSTTLDYRNFSFTANFNGSSGQDIYNNTATGVLPISNLGTRNIGAWLLDSPVQEALTNPIAPSSRYIENGSYLKLANATLNYRVGNIGTAVKNLNVFVNGGNLFVITKYRGFDPEVNTDKSVDDVPSSGIDNVAYPTARTYNLGVNFSL